MCAGNTVAENIMAPLSEKSGVITNSAVRERWLLEGDHGDRCQICHRPWARAGWRGFNVHHIIHGANGRSDEPCNLLLVCGRCHDMIHDGCYRDERTKLLLPAITLGMVLWVKSHTEEWDESRLTLLYHRTLPAREILAGYCMEERCRWDRNPDHVC